MFRKLLMTVLAVVAIGFGVGATAEAGDSGFWSLRGGSKKSARVTVFNKCTDTEIVYVMWLPSGSTVDPRDPAVTIGQLLDNGARPNLPWYIFGVTFDDLAPGDGVLWAFDGKGNFGSLPATIQCGQDGNWFKIEGKSFAPVVSPL